MKQYVPTIEAIAEALDTENFKNFTPDEYTWNLNRLGGQGPPVAGRVRRLLLQKTIRPAPDNKVGPRESRVPTRPRRRPILVKPV